MLSDYFRRHPGVKDVLGIIVFVACVIIGAMFINNFIFRSFNVEGPSMETTMYTGDRLIVNRLPVTFSQIQNKQYLPERGEIIVFKNPQFNPARGAEEYIVKRVIALPGERVVLANGHYTVYNAQYPGGFDPDDANGGEPGSPTSGEVDEVVPEGTIFVSGDHRQEGYSLDSRNGLGMIPLYDIVGPVSLRIFPFTSVRAF